METFLLLLILIVMLGALGWLPGVVRALAVAFAIVAGAFALFAYLASGRDTRPDFEKAYDQQFEKDRQRLGLDKPGR
jgi:membrane protein implicated in regulation of membrane protease activity